MPIYDPNTFTYIFTDGENDPFTIPAEFERYNVIGNSLDNRIIGNFNDNVLDGGAGADILVGGNGDDTYYIDNISDLIIETGWGGAHDRVHSTISYTLPDNVEYLTLKGVENINGTGNKSNNEIRGNAGDNILDGGEGNDRLYSMGGKDTLIGGMGNDDYYIYSSDVTIIEADGEGIDSLTISTSFDLSLNGLYIENLYLVSNGPLNGTGNKLDNLIVGNAFGNVLIGNEGNDTLDSGWSIIDGQSDELFGGTGDDTYILQDIHAVVHEADDEGIDTIQAFFNFNMELTPFVENFELLYQMNAREVRGNDLANYIKGNINDNRLYGGKGDDTLDGGGEHDEYWGGDGNDTFIIRHPGSVIHEGSDDAGVDHVITYWDYSLDDNVENLTALTGGSLALRLTGNALSNKIVGNEYANIISGGGGADRLYGGGGKDVLNGGAGQDTFVFNTRASSGNVDTIKGYKTAEDSIQLDNQYFAKLGSGTDSSPRKLSSKFFVAGSKAKDKNDYLIYNKTNGYLSYDADGSGAKYKPVLIAKLDKNLKMTYHEFFVI